MEYEELIALLDITSGKDLAYFEQYAELVESEDYISPEALSQLFEEVDNDALAELTDGYFEELLEKNVPVEEVELYTLLQTIGRALSGLAQMPDDPDEATASYADEFYRFRSWYTIESEVRCERIDEDAESESEIIVPLMQALTMYRSQHLSDDEYTYDFSDTIDYAIDEYAILLESLAESSEDEPYDDIDDE
ncbi:MAG: hypothetical protein LBT52_01950 [Clostridiales Family XIII bacterium]|jgi:hypothetical protein|nr:hypothetical protein [Clostridiales Family XIII bacterium]